MGGQQSRASTSIDLTNKVLTRVLLNSSNNCQQNSSNVQTINFDNIRADAGCSLNFSGISQKTRSAPNLVCAADNKNNTALMDEIKNDLQQTAKAETSGLAGALFSSSDSNNTANVVNEVVKNIDITNLSNCVNTSINQNTSNFTNIIGSCPAYCRDPKHVASPYDNCKVDFNNISQDLLSQAVGNCTANNAGLVSATNKLDTAIKQEAEAKNTGINIAASLAGSLCFWCIIIIICSVLMGGAGAGGGGGGGSGGGGGGTNISISPEMMRTAAMMM